MLAKPFVLIGFLALVLTLPNEPSAETMGTPEWVTDLFRAVDSMDSDGFVGFMTEDVFFRNGSAEPLRGRDAVRDDIGSLYARIKRIHHVLSDTWVQGNVVVVHGTVTYTRPDDSTLTVPFADIWKMNGELIQEYMIFIDNTKLQVTSVPATPTLKRAPARRAVQAWNRTFAWCPGRGSKAAQHLRFRVPLRA